MLKLGFELAQSSVANMTGGVDCSSDNGGLPWDEASRYLVRDRDRIYGTIVTRRLCAMSIRDEPAASASPWQNGFAGSLIGWIRRECANHVIVFGKAHLRRILRSYGRYYNGIRPDMHCRERGCVGHLDHVIDDLRQEREFDARPADALDTAVPRMGRLDVVFAKSIEKGRMLDVDDREPRGEAVVSDVAP